MLTRNGLDVVSRSSAWPATAPLQRCPCATQYRRTTLRAYSTVTTSTHARQSELGWRAGRQGRKMLPQNPCAAFDSSHGRSVAQSVYNCQVTTFIHIVSATSLSVPDRIPGRPFTS